MGLFKGNRNFFVLILFLPMFPFDLSDVLRGIKGEHWEEKRKNKLLFVNTFQGRNFLERRKPSVTL